MSPTALRDAVLAHKLFTKTRLYSLYSDFRKLREANPDGYEANLIAWRSLITELFDDGVPTDAFVLNTDGLLNELTLAEYGKPLALDLVLEERIAQGELIPLRQFMERVDGLYVKKWVRPVLSWAVNRFVWDTSYKMGDKKTGLKSDKLISKKKLEAFSDELLKRLVMEDEHSKQVYSKEQFKQKVRSMKLAPHLTDLDFDILIKFLERDLGKLTTREEVIKIGKEPVTEEDIEICQIKSTVTTLEAKIKELQEKINNTDTKLKQSLKSKANKELSLNLLRSKKIAEQSLTKQVQSLTQLESILLKIDESSTNIQLLSALEKGASLLKSLNTQIGGVERVEKIMDEVEDAKDTTDQITGELSRLAADVPEDEIEEEFEQLLKEESAKQKVEEPSSADDIAQRLSDLKLAPTDEPKEKAKEEERQPIAN